jgi:hypothetical protein
MLPNRRHALLTLGLFTFLMLAITAACAPAATPAPTTAPTEAMQMEHSDETPAADDHEHSDETIPNNGAVVRIVAPEDGATISGNEVEVKIEVEHFTLGENGQHWHVYVDGSGAAMVTGTDTSQVLHGLEPGDHEIKVTLANGEHVELEEGATIHITVSG